MTEKLKKYESTIKKKHSIGWTPKFEEEFRTKLNQTVFIPIVIKTFEKLEWEIVYRDENSVEAKRNGFLNRSTEKITVSFDYGKVKVKSVSLGNEFWDNGNNSKRVRLFIYAFQQTEKEYDTKALSKLEKDVEKSNNWDDYQIPDSLPQPKASRKPQLWIPVVGGLLTALLLGFVLAFLSVKATYIIGLYEVGVAISMGYILKQLIKLSNYTVYNHLHYLLIGMILLTYTFNQYFQYLIIFQEHNLRSFSFWEFIKARFEIGLQLKSLDTGWIGLLISWGIQLVITYIVGALKLSSGLISYLLNRVPVEVVDFAIYHFVKEKSEDDVRNELSKYGWRKKQDQDEVFESIGAMEGATELNRME